MGISVSCRSCSSSPAKRVEPQPCTSALCAIGVRLRPGMQRSSSSPGPAPSCRRNWGALFGHGFPLSLRPPGTDNSFSATYSLRSDFQFSPIKKDFQGRQRRAAQEYRSCNASLLFQLLKDTSGSTALVHHSQLLGRDIYFHATQMLYGGGKSDQVHLLCWIQFSW